MTHHEAEALIQPLVAAWTPDPVSRGAFYRRGATKAHCIGGIVCRELVPWYPGRPEYPHADHLARTIFVRLNPALHWQDALYLAQRVIEYNDKGRYADAWECVLAGLSASSDASHAPEGAAHAA